MCSLLGSYRKVGGNGACGYEGDDSAGDSSLSACEARCSATAWCAYFSAKGDGSTNVDCMLYRSTGCDEKKLDTRYSHSKYVTYAKPGTYRKVGTGACGTGGDDSKGDSSLSACQARCSATDLVVT